MTALVREWEAGAEPRRSFAQRHGITVAQFDYWKRRVRAPAEAPGFAPVTVVRDRPVVSAPSIEIVLGVETRVAIGADAPTTLVQAVLATLRAPC